MVAVVLAAVSACAPASVGTHAAAPPLTSTVTVSLDRALSSFRPDATFGAGLDGHGQGDTRRIFTRHNIRAMGSVGFGTLAYRLRTELGVEAWHWNPRGTWSDPAHRQGYWTSSSAPGPPIRVSYGYRLPRRGDTHDQAGDSGYSRIDDGSLATFWKSNPYLDPHYTGPPDAGHPQWVMVDLGRRRAVDAARISWGTPYATRFRVQYYTGRVVLPWLMSNPTGEWRGFPGAAAVGRPGTQTVRLARRPVRVRYVRLLLTRSSHTAPPGSRDVRDRLGYAVRELSVGRLAGGRLIDAVRHGRSATRQSVIYVSSTDPWHRASDLDRDTEQPGLDRVFRTGLAARSPAMVAVPMLYGTPADAVAEMRYLRRRGHPVNRWELGEEPDGQLALPEDYAALYLQWARALHRSDPRARLGGPGFQTAIPDWFAWPDARGDRSWTGRFLRALRAHRALRELSFFSFEWYPFDSVCTPPAPQLARAPSLLSNVIGAQYAAGLPRSVPLVISEYGYSAFAGRAEVDLAGALLNADVLGQFIEMGVATAYLYGWEPDIPIRETTHCDAWGNLMTLLADGRGQASARLPTYYGARLVLRQWAQPGSARHQVLALTTTGDTRNATGQPLVSAHAVRRPDGRLALILIDKDPARAADVSLATEHAGASAPLTGPLDVYAYDGSRYRWRAQGPDGHPVLDLPPLHTVTTGPRVHLTPMSLTIVRTRDAVSAVAAS